MGVQFIKSPGGEDMAVLPRREYDALVRAAADAAEDAADIAAYDAAIADAEGSRALPFEVSQAMLQGASLLKAIRLWRDIGQVKLADAIGTSQGFVSDIENRRRKITPDIARKLGGALDVPANWFA